jgi:hypothetical protein
VDDRAKVGRLGAGLSGVFEPLSVGKVDAAVDVAGIDDLRHGVGQFAQACLARHQGLSLRPLFGDVANEGRQAAVRRRVRLEREPASPRFVAVLEVDRHLLGHGAPELGFEGGADNGRKQLPHVAAEHIGAAEPVDALGLGVDVHDAPVAVVSDEAVGDALERGGQIPLADHLAINGGGRGSARQAQGAARGDDGVCKGLPPEAGPVPARALGSRGATHLFTRW